MVIVGWVDPFKILPVHFDKWLCTVIFSAIASADLKSLNYFKVSFYKNNLEKN